MRTASDQAQSFPVSNALMVVTVQTSADFSLDTSSFPEALRRDLVREPRIEPSPPLESKGAVPGGSKAETTPEVKPKSPGGMFRYEGNLYGSKSEAACAALLERYLPGFEIEPGKTFQIPAGEQGRSRIDFKINNVLVEYHPTNLILEFGGPTAYMRWERSLWKLSTEERALIISKKVQSLAHRYELHRQELIENDPKLRNCELIVVHSPEELYHKVIKPLGRNVPNEKAVVEEFFDLIGEVRRANESGYKKAPRKNVA